MSEERTTRRLVTIALAAAQRYARPDEFVADLAYRLEGEVKRLRYFHWNRWCESESHWEFSREVNALGYHDPTTIRCHSRDECDAGSAPDRDSCPLVTRRRMHPARQIAFARELGVFDHVPDERLSGILGNDPDHVRGSWSTEEDVVLRIWQRVELRCRGCGEFGELWSWPEWDQRDVVRTRGLCRLCDERQRSETRDLEHRAKVAALRKLGVMPRGTLTEGLSVLNQLEQRGEL